MAGLTDYAVRACRVHGPNDRADVVRIFNTVEHDDERRPFRAGDKILDAQPVRLVHVCDHALMRASTGQTIELADGRSAHANTLLLRHTNEL